MDRRLVTVNLDKKDAGLMVDISEGGLAVQALARIKQGTTTALQFELPETATRIDAIGTVAWADATSGRAGVRFETLSAASAASLKEWIERQAPQQTPATDAAPTNAPALLGPGSKVAEIAALQREIASQGIERDEALAVIIQRARGLTRADGAAIVLGDSKSMTCCASSGSAPPVGAEMRPESGLSGECVRTGVTVRCEDTELDPRVDREACRSLNIRSAVIVPLFARGNISGLVELFYASSRGFDGRDVLTLRRMADLISAMLCGPPTSREAKPPLRLATAPRSPAPKPPTMGAAGAPPMTRPVSQPAAAEATISCGICGHENPRAAVDCAKCGVPLTGRSQSAADLLPDSTPLDSDTDEEGRWLTLHLNASPRMLILIALLLLLMSIWGWEAYKSRQAKAAPTTNTTLAIEPLPSR